MNTAVPSLLPVETTDLFIFEITYQYAYYADPSVKALAVFTIRSKSVPNAIASFNRAVPDHGPIKAIKKVVPK